MDFGNFNTVFVNLGVVQGLDVLHVCQPVLVQLLIKQTLCAL